jgi:hypothetical protein
LPSVSLRDGIPEDAIHLTFGHSEARKIGNKARTVYLIAAPLGDVASNQGRPTPGGCFARIAVAKAGLGTPIAGWGILRPALTALAYAGHNSSTIQGSAQVPEVD